MPRLQIYHLGFLGVLCFAGIFDPRLWGLALLFGFFGFMQWPKGKEPQLKKWHLFLLWFIAASNYLIGLIYIT